jgi:hypothetical protein
MELSSGTIQQNNDINGNEKRKATSVPTLMITVKNEMAQSIDEQTIPTNGTFRIYLRYRELIDYYFRLYRNCYTSTYIQ